MILLGEPNPELVIDETGKIVSLTNVQFRGVNAGKGVGETLTAANPANPQVILDDIIYDQAGKATFYANALPEGHEGVIWGNRGLVESQRTWDYVLIINASAFDLVINHIDTSDGAAVVDIILLGGIENTIGWTIVENQRGHIRVDERDLVVEQGALPAAIFDKGLIRTNTLDVDTSGDIGNQNASDGRSPLMVELVRITHATQVGQMPTLKEVHLEADAGGDAVLDIALHDRSQTPALGSLAVTIHRITAGDDVDVVVNDSKAGDNLSDIKGITVRTFDPADPPPGGATKARTGEYFDHFSPDVTGESLYNFIRRTYGTAANEVDSTYTFLEVRAGDDIDIGHVTTTAPFGEPRSYATTSIGGTPYGASVVADVPDTTVHFIVNTDVAWTGGTSDDGVPQIFLTTNGNITATELIGDMLVGHIHSTEGNVTLVSGRRILDADGLPSIDVTGVNITMTSGAVTPETPVPSLGGIGTPTDFLEINVDRNNGTGVLNAFDTNAPSNGGIWISTTTPADMNNPVDADFQRLVVINGIPMLISNRAVVLTFTPGDWDQDQQVFIYAPDDNRSEGDRVVVAQHTVISADGTYDGMAVRNVEVGVRDNDTPGIRVTEIEQGSFDPVTGAFIEDRRTLVIEGDAVTELRDELLVQLATGRGIDPADEIVVRLDLDEDSDQQIRVFNPLGDPRFDVDARTITFTAADWDKPVLVSIGARDDFAEEDPFTAVISFVRDADLTIDANGDYLFPNLRSGHGMIAIEVIDNDTPGAVVLESGGSTLLIVDNLDTLVDETKTDDYFVRLTMQPTPGTTAVTEDTITLTTAFTGSGNPAQPTEVMDDVVLSNLTREGIYEGHVELNAADRQLIRPDMSSWLADGFLEGQRVRITNNANPAETVDLKIAIIHGDNETFDEKLEFTAETPLPAWWMGTLDVTVTRIAAVVNFDDTNWYVQQTVELRADPYFEVPLTRQGVKIFPVSTHLLSKLKRPLAVEGGVTGADRSLKSGLKLPGEADDFPLQINAQPPESQQIDVLNIFNDSSRQNWSGRMTQTTLTGFGMAKDLDFAALLGIDVEGVFGESAFVPGGISCGKVNFGDGGFGTDANQSLFEDPFATQGRGSIMLLSDPAISAGTDLELTVHVADPNLPNPLLQKIQPTRWTPSCSSTRASCRTAATDPDFDPEVLGDPSHFRLMPGGIWATADIYGHNEIRGESGDDTIYGGGNNLLNADDVLSTNGWLKDIPDTHPAYEDLVFGGAGLDILIGNTGGDRLIDWVGEFNTYLVPFAPFGTATVSRMIAPQLPEFPYALSASDGADPTRATDIGGDPERNGEPHGELGLIIQQDHGLWQDQTGGRATR